ncbi:hypothetical protein QBC36DRAFT_45202 [Triangularia setosa]|uniref:Uncharacterized protein n=1 Tax=Triangularia setosa TaxID=2587417 RepID=A0AAN6W2H9_9PEZI|nr:hypothetical protein QBC36DRAFT_45202 [Podospora setosa]
MRIHSVITCMGFVQLSWAAKKCYYPNGVEAITDTPCDPDAEDSMCCFKGGSYGRACLSNKMCQAPDGKIIRGTCTDRNWKSPECAPFCMNVGNGGANLISCSNVTNKDTSYCCEKTETGTCCDGGIGRFEVMPPKPVTLALWDSSEGVYTPVTQVSTSISTSTTTTSSTPSSEPSASKTTDTISAKETGSSSSGGPSGGSTGDTREGSTGGSGEEAAPSSSSGGLPVAAQAGIGVGVAAIVVLLAVIAWLVWKLNKNKQALVEPKSFLDPTQQPSPYVQEWYKQQQQQQQPQYQDAAELRSGRDWDQSYHGTPGSSELAHYGPQKSAELPAESNRYA